MAHTAADLNRIKTKALGTAEPWKTAWSLFQQFGPAASYTPSPVPHETIGVGQFQIRADASAAWSLALRWQISGDPAYRDAAIRVINAWTSTLQSFDPADNLSASRVAVGFGNAAEILIHGGAPWPAADIARLKSMMLDLLYPALATTKIDGMKGNQGIDAMSGLLAIAVFCDDQAKFDYVVNAYKNHPNCAVTAYIHPSGQSGEHGRDQAHPTGGMRAFDEIARTALNQGIDLYSWAGDRLLAGFEFWSAYNLGRDDLPFAQFGVYTYSGPSQIDRGRLSFINFESIHDAYITRRGLSSPYFEQAAARMRPDPSGDGTLRFYNGPASSVAQLIPSGSQGALVCKLNNLALGTPANSSTNGVQFTAEPYNARTSQRWTFTHLGMNIYSLVNAQGKATDIPAADENTGAKVQVYTPNSGLQQRWRAITNPDGTFSLLNLNSSMGLTLANDYPGSGGLLIQGTIFPATRLSQRWTFGSPSASVPATPPVVATDSLSTGEIVVSWDYTALASGYSVKRATAAAGPFSGLVSGLAANVYTDDTAAIGQTYYYSVAAANANGTGSDSAPVFAIGGIPAPWTSVSIGTNATGATAYANASGAFNVSGSGGDISGTADSFHFLANPMSGDGTVIARLGAGAFPTSQGKVGLMMRESNAANSRMALVMLDRGASKGLRMAYRAGTGGGVGYTGVGPTGIDFPVWLKIQRAGNLFTTAYSTNGVAWTTIGSASVAMAADIQVGAAVCPRSASEASVAYENLEAPLPGGFQSVDIGAVGSAGHAAWLAGTYTVKGSGGDIGGTADSFRYVSRGLAGDGTITARLSAASYVGTMGKIGLMFRESSAANARMVFVMLDRGASSALRMANRAAPGGNTGYIGAGPSGVTPPRWLRIQRAGNLFTTAHSVDGVTWTTLGSVTVTMPAAAQVGFAVCARSSGLATAAFDNVSVAP